MKHRIGRASVPLLAAGLLSLMSAVPQELPAQSAAPAPTTPTLRPAEVASVDAIVATLYAAISGGAGEARNWDRFRALFVPEARLIPTGQRADGTRTLRTMTVEEYVRTVGPQLERSGFYEREIGRREARYGNIVHLMSAYDSKRALSDAQPFARGVNSIQLWNDGSRWWVVTIYWESETPANPLPADLLTKP